MIYLDLRFQRNICCTWFSYTWASCLFDTSQFQYCGDQWKQKLSPGQYLLTTGSSHHIHPSMDRHDYVPLWHHEIHTWPLYFQGWKLQDCTLENWSYWMNIVPTQRTWLCSARIEINLGKFNPQRLQNSGRVIRLRKSLPRSEIWKSFVLRTCCHDADDETVETNHWTPEDVDHRRHARRSKGQKRT